MAALAKSGMNGESRLRRLTRNVMGIMHIDKGDARGVVLAQRKLITTQTDFQRIAHGGHI